LRPATPEASRAQAGCAGGGHETLQRQTVSGLRTRTVAGKRQFLRPSIATRDRCCGAQTRRRPAVMSRRRSLEWGSVHPPWSPVSTGANQSRSVVPSRLHPRHCRSAKLHCNFADGTAEQRFSMPQGPNGARVPQRGRHLPDAARGVSKLSWRGSRAMYFARSKFDLTARSLLPRLLLSCSSTPDKRDLRTSGRALPRRTSIGTDCTVVDRSRDWQVGLP
jgi:hypothetical protein